MRLSRRACWEAPANALAQATASRAAAGGFVDLTASNPTRAGIEYPDAELAASLARAATAPYVPAPLGLPAAREALAQYLEASGWGETPPDDLVITASTSEAYSFLFKVLCDPGDSVVTPVPSYPLLDHLTELDGVRLVRCDLELEERWSFFAARVAAACDAGTRALVAVHPNNPTGSFLTVAEQDAAAESCDERGMALICDEVFWEYPLDAAVPRAASAALRRDVPCFALGGLSKSAGLPHWKLGWIRLGGPAAARARARQALELVADSYLSVSTPVQSALADVLALAPAMRTRILERVRRNLAALRAAFPAGGSVTVLPVEGGWSAVMRVPRTASDEEMALALVTGAGVLVHPGYLFDFPGEGFLVVSLLPLPEEFAEGVRRLRAYLLEG